MHCVGWNVWAGGFDFVIRNQKTKAARSSVTLWPGKNSCLAAGTDNWAVDAGFGAHQEL